MAFDGLFLRKIKEELKVKLSGSRVDKISQPEKDEIIVSFRGREGNFKVLMTSSSDTARVHLTEETRKNPLQAPLFNMVLRKNIGGGKLKDIVQINGDRILDFIIESTDEMGFDSKYHLIVEIMGKHSNIVLVRDRDNKIIECIKHVGMDVNSYRLLLPGAEYKLPPPQEKTEPSEITEEKLNELNPDYSDKSVFMKYISGIGKKTSEVLHSVFTELKAAGKSDAEAFTEVIGRALSTEEYFLFLENEIPRDISLLEPPEAFMEKEGYDDMEIFDSPSRCLEYFTGEKDLYQRVKERSQDIMKIVTVNYDRVVKKIEILNGVIEEAGEKDDLMESGELIKANINSIPEGAEEVSLFNFYDENGGYKTIELDPHKTAAENMQIYFRKYNKHKRSAENAQEQLILAGQELDYLSSVQDSIMRSEDASDIAEIRQELIVAGYIRYRSTGKKKESPTKPMRFKSTEGVTIYVGKNNNQNDYLTTKFASPYDTWLHTKDYPGSHVIIKGSDFSDETLLEAANLAAYYSKASSGSKVPVDYTKVKFVKKPAGSKPGMVIYSGNRTVYVDPGAPRLERF